MRAALYEVYGAPDVVRVVDVPRPAPRADEILVRVRATTVTSADSRIRRLHMPTGFGLAARIAFGVTRPRRRILGAEVAGVVEEVGRAVFNFQAGDRVFAINGLRLGCHAEFVCIRADGAIAVMPSKLDFESAAAIPFGGTTAMDFLRRTKVDRGDRILVNGAAGAVGTALVQLAYYLGATVTGVCSARNTELVRSLGATKVIDYGRDDFTWCGETYDVVFDTVGNAAYPRSQQVLAPNGRLALITASLPDILSIPRVVATSRRRIVAGPVTERAEDLRSLAQLTRSGRYRPVIARRFSFDQIIEAHRHVDKGHKVGSVVITMD